MAVKSMKKVKKNRPARKTAARPSAKKKATARRFPARSAAKKPRTPVKAARPGQGEKVVGAITHYFPKVRAAVVNLKAPLAVGERVRIKGHTTDFTQDVSSLQIDHVTLKKAKKGDIIGLLVQSRVRRHDIVLRA